MGAVQFNPVTRGYAVTLAPAGKYPIVGDRIYYTLQDAQDYVDGKSSSKTAIPGIYLSVIADGDNNGAYWVAQAAGYEGATVGILQKMGEGGGSSGGGGGEVTFSLASNTTNAVSLTINGATNNITAATLKTSLGLKALAYKASLAFSELTNKPTTLAGYGITDGITYASAKDNDFEAYRYKMQGEFVLHRSGTITYLNYGFRDSSLRIHGNSINHYIADTVALSINSDRSVTASANLTVGGNLIANNEILGLKSASASYPRFRVFSHPNGLFFQAATYDGTSTAGKIGFTGYTGVAAEDIYFNANTIRFLGAAQFPSLATFNNGLKIGDAIISWDATAGMLKIDKGVYVEGAITAKKKA